MNKKERFDSKLLLFEIFKNTFVMLLALTRTNIFKQLLTLTRTKIFKSKVCSTIMWSYCIQSFFITVKSTRIYWKQKTYVMLEYITLQYYSIYQTCYNTNRWSSEFKNYNSINDFTLMTCDVPRCGAILTGWGHLDPWTNVIPLSL